MEIAIELEWRVTSNGFSELSVGGWCMFHQDVSFVWLEESRSLSHKLGWAILWLRRAPFR